MGGIEARSSPQPPPSFPPPHASSLSLLCPALRLLLLLTAEAYVAVLTVMQHLENTANYKII